MAEQKHLLDYETPTRHDEYSRRLRWIVSTTCPTKAWRWAALVGLGMMIWGGALLPGGTFVTWSGVAVSAAVIVRGVGFLTIVRPILFPTMRTQGLTVGFLIWLVLAGVIHGGNAIGLTPPLAAWVLRPLWVVPADRYLEAPYNADQSRVVFVGPYFLYDASVGPGGIRGHVFGGGSIRIAWDSVNGYRMVSASAMH